MLKEAIRKVKRSMDFTTNKVTYAQAGEDLILANYYRDKPDGFYVDVGAYHPKKMSNTAYFYQLGWRGINVEPQKKNFARFVKDRKRDINLNTAVGTTTGTVDFYEGKPGSKWKGGVSSMDKEWVQKHSAEFIKVSVPITTLKIIFDTHLKPGQNIDVMSVDVEGRDLDVLKSNDWKKYRPEFIIIETQENAKQIDKFMVSKGYKKEYQLFLNSIYKRQKN